MHYKTIKKTFSLFQLPSLAQKKRPAGYSKSSFFSIGCLSKILFRFFRTFSNQKFNSEILSQPRLRILHYQKEYQA
ncbi:hypothetical protein DFQ12_5677 [Sphingobacterium detergens]|uniref:Uncharacterized protein n=1 Tax=Sphingobacterium detergens TaxID=1145106 RepID=A0A420AC52_SPHD1|nr:hypothetical protein DFQ12_5677 [Sphingobacterium detergens]